MQIYARACIHWSKYTTPDPAEEITLSQKLFMKYTNQAAANFLLQKLFYASKKKLENVQTVTFKISQERLQINLMGKLLR